MKSIMILGRGCFRVILRFVLEFEFINSFWTEHIVIICRQKNFNFVYTLSKSFESARLNRELHDSTVLILNHMPDHEGYLICSFEESSQFLIRFVLDQR